MHKNFPAETTRFSKWAKAFWKWWNDSQYQNDETIRNTICDF